MIFQQYTNAYLLFDDDQPQAAAVAAPTGGTYGAGKRLYLSHALIEMERSRRFQDTIVHKERQKQRAKQLSERYQADRQANELQRQRCIWATVLCEV